MKWIGRRHSLREKSNSRDVGRKQWRLVKVRATFVYNYGGGFRITHCIKQMKFRHDLSLTENTNWSQKDKNTLISTLFPDDMYLGCYTVMCKTNVNLVSYQVASNNCMCIVQIWNMIPIIPIMLILSNSHFNSVKFKKNEMIFFLRSSIFFPIKTN